MRMCTVAASRGVVESQWLLAMREEAADEQTTTRIFAPAVVPAAIQSPSYARAVLSANGLVRAADYEAAVGARVERARAFRTSGRPSTVIVTQSALARMVGGPETMDEQRALLLGLDELPHITLRVLRDTERPAALWSCGFEIHGGAETTLDTPDGGVDLPQALTPRYLHHFQSLYRSSRPYT